MISVRHVCMSFGGRPALEDCCLEVGAGERIVIQGPSGSGKTTLLRVIAGLELPEAGEVWLDDQVASRPRWGTPPHLRGVGMVFPRSALWPHMNVVQNLRFALDGWPREERESHLRRLLEEAEIGHLAARHPSQLSSGEARRVALARALAPRPRRLLLDEPMVNLDPALKRSLLDLILRTAAATRATVVMVSHDEDEVEAMGGGRYRMESCRIAEVAG